MASETERPPLGIGAPAVGRSSSVPPLQPAEHEHDEERNDELHPTYTPLRR